jgi:uncharacterized membrane protein YbhN (UPF0104 family)
LVHSEEQVPHSGVARHAERVATLFRRHRPLALRFLLAAVLLIWMTRSGKLDLHRAVEGLSQWRAMSAILILLFLQPGITAWRWNLLLRAQDIRISYARAFGLTMIGLLFNVAIPGAVGGDLIKGYYIARVTKGRRCSVATAILMDRLAGMLGLFLLAVVMVLANIRQLPLSGATNGMGTMVIVGLTICMGVLSAIVLAGHTLSEWNWLPGIARNVFRSAAAYSSKGQTIPTAVAASVLSHLLACTAYYVSLRSAAPLEPVSMAQFFLLVPLGFVALAVPISPAGIGIGQAAFFALFRIISLTQAKAAAEAFTVYQCAVIMVSLTGFCWYLSYKDIHIPEPEDGRSDAVASPRPIPRH